MKIKIKRCDACGEIFANLTPDSEHEVVETPSDRSENEIWVMGIGEKVRVLHGEYDII